MFSKLLIANRGEIACRIIRTCRRMGIATVAVFSDVDARSLHVRMADEAVALGGSAAQESYLAIDKILAAAAKTGATAIHPGYGFLSENDLFADACIQAGLVFIGPPGGAIRAMGSKSAAKALMQSVGIPLIPGYHGEIQDAAYLSQKATDVGFPILIKASAGGGGKGMRLVENSADFMPSLAACKREALAAFGDDHILLERYIAQPRHIEVQVFADQHGNVLSLFERDCSVQRRHQKILEEAPAPGISQSLRAAISQAARQAAASVRYVGAGTVEFLVDAAEAFYFMEMNTRLQVEHPVTELITGLDLVEWQLRVASGEPLPLVQDQIAARGHAIEARIYAEDPAHDFLPSVGRLIHLRLPSESPHVRIESGVEQDDVVTAFYDPMLAKLIVWDETRELARQRLYHALGTIEIVGLSDNIAFLRRVVASPSFAQARLRTDLLTVEQSWIAGSSSADLTQACLFAALSVVLPQNLPSPSKDPWSIQDGWRVNHSFARTLTLLNQGATYIVSINYEGSSYRLTLQDRDYCATGYLRLDGSLVATIDGLQRSASVVHVNRLRHIFLDGERSVWTLEDLLGADASEAAGAGTLRSPLPGRLVALLVEPNVRVEKGAPLLRIEAMKMEYTIEAPYKGKVLAFNYLPGEQVSEDTELLQFERELSADRSKE